MHEELAYRYACSADHEYPRVRATDRRHSIAIPEFLSIARKTLALHVGAL